MECFPFESFEFIALLAWHEQLVSDRQLFLDFHLYAKFAELAVEVPLVAEVVTYTWLIQLKEGSP